MKHDYYRILGLPVNATPEDVSHRYRNLAPAFHPDVNGESSDTDRLALINTAYSVLRQPDRRREYDVECRQAPARQSTETAISGSQGGLARTPARSPEPFQKPTGCCELLAAPSPILACRANSTCEPNCPLRQAHSAFNKGFFAAAGDLCRLHLAKNDKSHGALEILGDVFGRQFQLDQAMTAYRSALRLLPNDSRLQAKIMMLNPSTAGQVGKAPASANKPPTPLYLGTKLRAPQPAPAAERRTEATPAQGPQRTGRTAVMNRPPRIKGADILVVEDNDALKAVTARILQAHGFTVLTASNGEEAVTMARRSQFRLALMDVMMPVRDGLWATREIRRWETMGDYHLPIIALTTLDTAGDRERCLSAGMDFYVKKPVQAQELIDSVHCFIAAPFEVVAAGK